MHSSLLLHLHNDTKLHSTFRRKGTTASKTAHVSSIVLLYIVDIVISIYPFLSDSLELHTLTYGLYTLYLSLAYSNFALEYILEALMLTILCTLLCFVTHEMLLYSYV